MLDGSRELSEVIEDVARLGARLIIQSAVEAEVDAFLGRARYQRAADCPDARAGSRNGFYDSTIKTSRIDRRLGRFPRRTHRPRTAAAAVGHLRRRRRADQRRRDRAAPKPAQRCLIHRCRNVIAKLSAQAQTEIHDAYWAIFDTDELTAAGMTPGPELVAAVRARIDAFADKYNQAFPRRSNACAPTGNN